MMITEMTKKRVADLVYNERLSQSYKKKVLRTNILITEIQTPMAIARQQIIIGMMIQQTVKGNVMRSIWVDGV